MAIIWGIFILYHFPIIANIGNFLNKHGRLIAQIVCALNDHYLRLHRQIRQNNAQRIEQLFFFDLFSALIGGDDGVAQEPPQRPRGPVLMPPIVPAPDACSINPWSPDCTVCLDPLSGECLMPPCRHAMHEGCMQRMFKNGHSDCPLCRLQIKTLVSKTLEESPKAPDDSSAGGASADAAPESPKASEE